MQILEFFASILGSLFLAFCAIFTLWMFLTQISLAIFSVLGIWIYFQGYPWIGLVLAIVGTLAGCVVSMAPLGFIKEDESDTHQSHNPSDTGL